jgi:RHS repeat-associated protein
LLALSGARAWAEQGSNTSAPVEPFFGAFTTRVPLAVPRFRGLEPPLELAYGSTGANGPQGMGWSLTGFSTIERASAGRGTPRYDGGDIFLLDGQELVPCASGSTSPSCLTGGTHSTRLESYQRIRFDGHTWTVTQKDGKRAIYSPLFPTSRGTFRWGLTSVADTLGNTVSLGWWCDGNPVEECYPESVQYNGTVVRLYREPRPDVLTWAHGEGMGQTRYRLKTVDVTVSGSRLRAYALRYTTSGSTWRSLLVSVQQYGSDAVLDGSGTVVGGTAQPALSFGWRGGGTGFRGTFGSGLVDWGYESGRQWVDFNGDGRADYCRVVGGTNGSSSHVACTVSTGTGFGATYSSGVIDWGYESERAWVDFDGDGRADYCRRVGGTNGSSSHVACTVSTGTGFGATYSSGVIDWGHESGRAWVDFDGDGKADYCRVVGNTNGSSSYVACTVSTGTGFGGTYSSGVIDWGYESGRQWTDFDGDGKADYCRRVGGTNGSSSHVACTVSTGTGFGGTYSSGVIDWGYESGRQWVDFNGDGRSDYCRVVGNTNISSSHVACTVSTGAGFGGTYASGVIDWGYDSGREWTDFNGDGRADYCRRVGGTNGSSSYLSCTVSTGTGFGNTWSSDVVDWGYDTGRQWVDVDGDGLSDYCRRVGGTNGSSSYLSCTPASGPVPDLLTSASNGQGGTTTVQYQPSTAWANTYLPLGAVLQTASAVTLDDGRGNSSTTRYQYQGALWSSRERRFLGFRKVTAVLDAAGNYTETYYHQHVGCISKPEVTYYRDAAGALFKYSTFEYSENAAPPYTSLMTSRWEYECNQTASCRRTLLQIGYDTYGNGYLTYEHGDYDVAGDERTSLRGLVPNTSAYVVALPAYENIYAGLGTGGTLLRQTLYEYDGSSDYTRAPTAGLLTRQLAWNNQTGSYSVRGFGHDGWGNRTRETDPRGHTSTVAYDSTYHLYPVSRCNALGQCSTQAWDGARGLVKSETDLNGGVTRYEHDALGRPVRTTLPDGSVETFAYLDRGNPWQQRVRRAVSDGTADGLWMEAYEDGLGRRYRTVKEGGATQETLYNNASNRAWKQSAWYRPGETPRYQTFAFDGLGRLRTVTNPDGTQAQRVYGNGYVATYDELGQEKVTWTDAYGQTVQVRERNAGAYAYTTYQYDLLGNLVRLRDAAGNTTSLTWDSLGRKLQGCDPDTGCSSYTYDAAGLMLSRRDARGQVTLFTYDALGRSLTTTYAHGEQVRRVYDEAGHGAGMGALTSVSDAFGSESLGYDFAGRVVSTTRCVTGLCFTTGRSYDAAGRLASVTYPDGEVVPYSYDTAGNLLSVGGYATGLTYDAGGHLLSIQYGNGTRASYAYDANRQWLTSAQVSGPSGTVYQASYSYDAKARVRGMSSSTHAQSNLGFSYDELDRLTGVSGAQTQSFAYDSLGNLTFNSQLGGYGYADTTHRHAVTAAGASAYTYDANGNMTSGGGRSYAWDGDNRLTRVTQASGTTTFSYDASGQRVKQSGPSGTTWYFGPHLEYGNNGLTRYYYAGPLLVARRDNSGVSWYHQDHLGSVRALTNTSGARVASYEYSAFGVPVASSASVSNTRGFTGHTADDTGLVYMGARYFDPALGRFLSADSLVPSSHSPQALNRYAYVYNNPISNTDPSGHVPVVAAIATAASVGAAVGWTSTAFIIATVGAATVTTGYFLKDPLLMSVGSILLGAASGFAFGVGYLSTAEPLMNAAIGGTMAALTSPVSPLDSGLKNALGWAYTAQSLLFEFNRLDERIQKGADKLRDSLDGNKLLADKAGKLDSLAAEQRQLMESPEKWTAWQRRYGEAMERATGGALTAGEAIALNTSGGLVGPGDGFFARFLDVTTGWIPGVRAHAVLHDLSGYLRTSFGVGNGYLYAGGWFGMSATNPLSGQAEGILTTGGGSASALFQRLF